MPNVDLFNRIFNLYYKTVYRVIKAAQKAPLNEKEIDSIITTNAFNSSLFEIKNKLYKEWGLLKLNENGTLSSLLNNNVIRPQTSLEKQWLSTIANDSRFELFLNTAEKSKIQNQLLKYQPLYKSDMWILYDQFVDGDNYLESNYKKIFQTVLRTIKEKRYISFEHCGRRHKTAIKIFNCIPLKLEYSPKNNKFRLLCVTQYRSCQYRLSYYNLGNMSKCKINAIIEKDVLKKASEVKPIEKIVVIEIIDDRNALQRAMLSFSDFEKEVEYLEQRHSFDVYKMKLKYYFNDETELLIRILSMGPLVKIIEGESLITKLKERLQKQAYLFQQNKILY